MEPATLGQATTQASARVLEGTLALARAEARLALCSFRAILGGVVIAAAVLCGGGVATAVAVVLVCVSPLLATIWGAPLVLLSIGVSLSIGVVLAALGMRRLQTAISLPQAQTATRPE